MCTLPGEYELSLTAEPKDDETPWKVVRLRLLVGSAEAAKLTTFSGASIDVEQLAITVRAKVQKLLDGTEVFGSDGSIIPAQSLQAKARAADIAAGRAAAGVAFADGPTCMRCPSSLCSLRTHPPRRERRLAVEVLHAQATALSRAQWNGFLTVGRANDGALALSYSFPLDDGRAGGGGGGGGGGSFRKRGSTLRRAAAGARSGGAQPPPTGCASTTTLRLPPTPRRRAAAWPAPEPTASQATPRWRRSPAAPTARASR